MVASSKIQTTNVKNANVQRDKQNAINCVLKHKSHVSKNQMINSFTTGMSQNLMNVVVLAIRPRVIFRV